MAFQSHTYYDHPCPECSGRGHKSCERCLGGGRVFGEAPFETLPPTPQDEMRQTVTVTRHIFESMKEAASVGDRRTRERGIQSGKIQAAKLQRLKDDDLVCKLLLMACMWNTLIVMGWYATEIF